MARTARISAAAPVTTAEAPTAEVVNWDDVEQAQANARAAAKDMAEALNDEVTDNVKLDSHPLAEPYVPERDGPHVPGDPDPVPEGEVETEWHSEALVLPLPATDDEAIADEAAAGPIVPVVLPGQIDWNKEAGPIDQHVPAPTAGAVPEGLNARFIPVPTTAPPLDPNRFAARLERAGNLILEGRHHAMLDAAELLHQVHLVMEFTLAQIGGVERTAMELVERGFMTAVETTAGHFFPNSGKAYRLV